MDDAGPYSRNRSQLGIRARGLAVGWCSRQVSSSRIEKEPIELRSRGGDNWVETTDFRVFNLQTFCKKREGEKFGLESEHMRVKVECKVCMISKIVTLDIRGR